ncbi:MAG: hypothetical protein K2N06_00785 [Oscillospiraceae bacterium]|nr:hypothetical protein [Oscillospiraceae bacterium]
MTGLLIAAAVLLVVLLILTGRVTVIFDYGEELYLKVSYLMFTVFKIPSKRKKTAKKDKKAAKSAKKAAKSAEKAEEKSEDSAKKEEKSAEKSEKSAEESKKPAEKSAEKPKPNLSDILALVKLALDSIGKPLKRILKRTEISHLRLEIICGGNDAAKAALNFGATNILVGNALGWVDNFFTLKAPDRINIGVDFQCEQTEYSAYCEVRLSLAAALGFLFSIIGRAVKYYGGHKEAKIAVGKLLGK